MDVVDRAFEERGYCPIEHMITMAQDLDLLPSVRLQAAKELAKYKYVSRKDMANPNNQQAGNITVEIKNYENARVIDSTED